MESNTRVMKKVAAFMYGNVRLSKAVSCYNGCNGLHQSRVETMLKPWYFVWDKDMNQRH